MSRFLTRLLMLTCIVAWCAPAFAQADKPPAPPRDAQAAMSAPKKPSPWILAPVFTSNPKLGVTLGGTVGYLRFFDPASNLRRKAAYASGSENPSRSSPRAARRASFRS